MIKYHGRWKSNMKRDKLFNCYNVINLQEIAVYIIIKTSTTAYNKHVAAIFGVITLEYKTFFFMLHTLDLH